MARTDPFRNLRTHSPGIADAAARTDAPGGQAAATKSRSPAAQAAAASGMPPASDGTGSAAIVSLKDITKVYGTAIRTQVLFDVNLDFAPESFNAIIGQSGSGKSTLLNIIGTLDRPTSGEVTIAGRRTDGLSRNQLAALRNETIGFIFQFHYLLPEFTAQENVLMPWWIKNGKPTPEVRARADELMRLMGIDRVRSNLAGNMSGGQQQRTAIARSLIMNPKIILADEPTGNLDSDTTETVYSLMREINRTFRTTFIIITHDRKVAEKADRIVEIKDGRISIDLKRDS